ncbi:MAG: SHOCT domain-containing protein [Gammaproteobacteria bacterium]|jgi:putative membrane protein|nr:SHOCT domain-containing protein [Gammaproteobacteria bacterium]
MHEWHGYGGGVMWIFWVLLVVVILWIVKTAAGGGKNSTGEQKSALDILQQRYARGEIEREEFEQKRKDLSR